MVATTTEVLAYAGSLYYVSIDRLKNIRKRDPYVLMARRAAILAFRRRGLSQNHIAGILGYKDHTTPWHHEQTASALEQTDPAFAANVARILLYANEGRGA